MAKWVTLILLKGPYAIIAAIEIIEAAVCTVNYVGKYLVGAIKGTVVPTTEKDEANQKLKKEYRDVWDAIVKIVSPN